jgi:hypothetical protein
MNRREFVISSAAMISLPLTACGAEPSKPKSPRSAVDNGGVVVCIDWLVVECSADHYRAECRYRLNGGEWRICKGNKRKADTVFNLHDGIMVIVQA